MLVSKCTVSGSATLEGPWGMATPRFCVAKRKKGKQREEKGVKPETIKRLSSRSKCYFFSHSRASRVQCLESRFQCSMASPL